MIEQMTHVAVVSKTADKDALLGWLYGERGFHVMPIDEKDDAWEKTFSKLPDDTQAIDNVVTRINSVLSFCQEHSSSKPSFLDAMLPLKVVGTKEEIDSAVQEVSIDTLYDKTADMRAEIEASNEKITRLQSQKSTIEQFAFLGDDLPKVTQLKNIKLDVVAVAGQGGKAFLLDERIVNGDIAAEELFADQTQAFFALAAPIAKADELKALIDDHALRPYPVPVVNQGAKQEIAQLDGQLKEAEAVLDVQKSEANRFADAWLKKVGLAAGYYESEKNLATARNGMEESSHLFVTRGYVKTDRLATLKRDLEAKISSAAVLETEAPEGEEPPTSLKWNKWIAPAALPVKMYGLPAYNSIDPTPFVATIFFAFVGICLGDAVYGLALIAIMLFLKWKYREQAGLQDFFQCFVYVGIATFIVGALGGSWMGNLTEIVPGMGKLDEWRTSIQLIDSIKDSQLALYIAIGIGVFTQFYGMALCIYKNLKRGDKMGAFSDGFLWMAFLLFAILGGFDALGMAKVWWGLTILSVVGLILTQGRDQQGWFGKIFVGIIAIYGIVGSYGVSAILGDLISYARLMALNLTGAALGSTFNMLAKLSTDIPVIGLIVAVLMIIFGHLMNFFLNLLGGFVHSARLIMLEFFGRFYESGGYAYKPYGFDSDTVEVKKK